MMVLIESSETNAKMISIIFGTTQKASNMLGIALFSYQFFFHEKKNSFSSFLGQAQLYFFRFSSPSFSPLLSFCTLYILLKLVNLFQLRKKKLCIFSIY